MTNNLDDLKRGDRVRVFFDFSKKKSDVFTVVSVSAKSVRVASFSVVTRWSRQNFADRLVSVCN